MNKSQALETQGSLAETFDPEYLICKDRSPLPHQDYKNFQNVENNLYFY